jgi:hypothetical protein
MSDAGWFKDLVEEFARKRKLRPRLLEDGPTEFHVQFGMRNGKPLYEIRVDLAKNRASFRTTAVPYGEIVWVFAAGTEERFSPFDDNTSAYTTPLDLRAWLEQSWCSPRAAAASGSTT